MRLETWASMWPQRHALILKGQVRVDMRFVCPKDVKNTLSKEARSAHWKEMGSEARVRRFEGRYMARASSGSAAKENKETMDSKASKRCQRRMGVEKALRHWLVR